MLKYNGVEYLLTTDNEMITLFKKGIRGEISQCTERIHEANNNYMPNYNPNEKPTYI